MIHHDIMSSAYFLLRLNVVWMLVLDEKLHGGVGEDEGTSEEKGFFADSSAKLHEPH